MSVQNKMAPVLSIFSRHLTLYFFLEDGWEFNCGVTWGSKLKWGVSSSIQNVTVLWVDFWLINSCSYCSNVERNPSLKNQVQINTKHKYIHFCFWSSEEEDNHIHLFSKDIVNYFSDMKSHTTLLKENVWKKVIIIWATFQIKFLIIRRMHFRINIFVNICEWILV